MFGFNVLTWNSDYQQGRYYQSLKRILLGGSPGHSAAELIIPFTEENRKLIEQVNENGKLLIEKSTTLVSNHIDTEPFYQASEVPCYKIYFSFWGDVNTKKTQERHRLLDAIKDNIEEGKGIPQQNSPKGEQILGDNSTEWVGLIRKTKGSAGIETVQHLAGLGAEQLQLSTEKMALMQSIEDQKELLLWHVKEISARLNKLKTAEKKQNYLTTEKVKQILREHEVASFADLTMKLSAMSAAINQLRKQLIDLNIHFGKSPDNIISFPIASEQQLEYTLDYKEILKEMGRIANSKVPYHALKMNCSTTIVNIINKGINPSLKDKLQQSGYVIPASNSFIDTSQSVFDYSLTLSAILTRANSSLPYHSDFNLKIINFLSKVYHFFVNFISILFRPSNKQQLLNQRDEYIDYIFNINEGLKQLEREFSNETIARDVYEKLHKNGKELVAFYRHKIITTEAKLLAKNYIKRTSDFDAQIEEFLKTYPAAREQSLLQLDSKDKIIVVIEKIASHIYSNIDNQEIYGDISYKEIIKKVSHYVENIVNKHGVYVKNFNYFGAKNLRHALQMASSIKQILNKELVGEIVTIDKDIAQIFLNYYEQNVTALKRKEQTCLRSLEKSEMGSKGTITLQTLLFKVQKELKEQNNAIEQIKYSLADRIEIVFPPSTKFGLIRLQDMEAFSALLSTKTDANWSIGSAGAVLNKNIKIFNKLKKLLMTSSNGAEELTMQGYDFGVFKQITETLNTFPITRPLSDLLIEQLALSVVNSICILKPTLPLSIEGRVAITSYLNLNKYVEKKGESLSNFSKLKEILSPLDSVQLSTTLADSDRINLTYPNTDFEYTPSLICNKLTLKEHRFVYLFDKIVTLQQKSSSQEQFELARMLEDNLGNLDLNKRLGLLEKANDPLVKKYALSIASLRHFIFKTRLTKVNDLLLAKCEKGLKDIEAGKKLDVKSKLTLFEFGRLDDLAKQNNNLELFKNLGLFKASNKLQKLHHQTLRANQLFTQIEKIISDENIYENGDIVMTHSKKSLALKSKSADTEATLMSTFVSKYSHSAQVYIDPETGMPTFSHIWGEHQIDAVKVTDITVSDIFRIDIIQLISPEMQEKLKDFYNKQGLNYQIEIANLYKKNSQKLLVHSKERFNGVKNDKYSRFQAGLASYGFFGGHRDEGAIDRSDIYNDMVSKSTRIKNKMICSEFVAKSLVAAIFETNSILHHHLFEAGLVKASDSIVNMPLKKENLARIHPQRLIELLQAENCLIQVNKSVLLEALVNQMNTNKKIDGHEVDYHKVLLSNSLINLVKSRIDKKSFIDKALSAFELYVTQEKLNIHLQRPRIHFFLKEHFSQLHDTLCRESNAFRIRSEIKKTLEKTLPQLEPLYKQAIMDNYKSVSFWNESTPTKTSGPNDNNDLKIDLNK